MPDTDKSAAQGLLAKVRWGLWLVVGIVGSALVIFALGRSDGGPEPSSYSNAFGGPFELMASLMDCSLEG